MELLILGMKYASIRAIVILITLFGSSFQLMIQVFW